MTPANDTSATETDWAGFAAAHRPGDQVQGTVSILSSFGVFVDVGGGIQGLIHVTELPGDNPEPDELEVGQAVSAHILRIDPPRETLSLSLRDDFAERIEDAQVDVPVEYFSRARSQIVISTMNDLPGHVVEEVLGEVFGLTVRSRHVGSQVAANFKGIVGGELRGMTKNVEQGREQALDRMASEAVALGANAVLAMRFDSGEMLGFGNEVCAYGTAVRVRRLGAAPEAASP